VPLDTLGQVVPSLTVVNHVRTKAHVRAPSRRVIAWMGGLGITVRTSLAFLTNVRMGEFVWLPTIAIAPMQVDITGSTAQISTAPMWETSGVIMVLALDPTVVIVRRAIQSRAAGILTVISVQIMQVVFTISGNLVIAM